MQEMRELGAALIKPYLDMIAEKTRIEVPLLSSLGFNGLTSLGGKSIGVSFVYRSVKFFIVGSGDEWSLNTNDPGAPIPLTPLSESPYALVAAYVAQIDFRENAIL